ncbi:MAG TPA: tRNA pseudouridine(13) synthase TruD [Myxococcales bacterium]|nr:tRNA pseudouridine(13) synthase TruD [Myxococcales bacterium]HIN86761.1 tRNA pseudouridine(13) synthase TruD [Myxococcales bacterium]
MQTYLTTSTAGVPATFDSCEEDFEVTEIPLYEPSDEGEHLYINFKKRGLTTRQVIRRAVELFGVEERNVGYAGLKDKNATTIQTISVHGISEAQAAQLADEHVEILWARLHRNKLRVGHLAGNRFRVRLRNTESAALVDAQAVLTTLAQQGLPNFYGRQRFGQHGDNAQRAREILKRGPRVAGSRWKAKLLISALQSELFNYYLAGRMRRGEFSKVAVGDVMVKVASGGVFNCDDPATDQTRYNGFEISISGPMFGPKMILPTPDTESAKWEEETLNAMDVALSDFKKVSRFAPGTRRPLRAPVHEPRITADEQGMLLEFGLPSGAYATVLIDEILKESKA